MRLLAGEFPSVDCNIRRTSLHSGPCETELLRRSLGLFIPSCMPGEHHPRLSACRKNALRRPLAPASVTKVQFRAFMARYLSRSRTLTSENLRWRLENQERNRAACNRFPFIVIGANPSSDLMESAKSSRKLENGWGAGPGGRSFPWKRSHRRAIHPKRVSGQWPAGRCLCCPLYLAQNFAARNTSSGATSRGLSSLRNRTI